ncbi:MAG: DUF3857 domain-containing protein [Flavobacteriales bacterium]
MKRIFLSLLTLVITLPVISQQATLKNAWSKFNNNEREEARKLFTEAAKDPSTAEEAHMALSLLCGVDRTSDVSFKHFMDFYKVSTNKYHYLNVLWFTESVNDGSGGKRTPQQLSFLKSLLKDPNLPGDLASKVHAILGDHFEALHDFKNSRKEYALIGSIDQWQVAGEFENISASGFDKEWEPIKNPGAASSFTNKRGAPVKWLDVNHIRNDKWVDLEYYYYASNSIIYAQTFVEAPADMEVQIRIGVSGSIKFWLNDQQMLTEDEERNNDLDNYIIKTTLKKGYNRLLLQMGESEAESCNFMVRITDDKGYAVPGLVVSQQLQTYPKGGNQSFKLDKPEYLKYFEEQVKEKPSDLLAHLMLAQAYLNADKKYESRKTLDKAEKLASNSGYVKMKLINVHIREENRTAIAKMVDWFKTNDAKNPFSIYLQFNEAIEQEDYNRADSIFQDMRIYLPSKQEVFDAEITLFDKKQNQEKLVDAMENAYKLFPDNGTFVGYKILIEQKIHNNVNKAISVMKKFYDKNFSIGNMEELAGMYFEAGKSAEGIKLYTKTAENFPVSIGLNYHMSQLYMQMRDYPTAISYMDKVMEQAPYISMYMSQMAKCYEESGNIDRAKEFYKKAILYSPNSYEERKRLRKLEGQKEDIFAHFDSRDVYKIFKEAPSASDYKDENSIVLLYDRQKVVYDGGGSEERVVLVAKVFNAAGIDDWKEYRVPVYGNGIIEKVEVLKANGSKMEAERSGGDIVFTNLEAGDGIHIAYRTESYTSGQLAKHFTEQHSFESGYPLLHISFALLIDRNVQFKWKFANKGFDPVKSAKDNFDKYVWERKNVAPIKSEWSMSRYVDFSEVLFLSTIPDWKWVSNWYTDLARTKQKADFELKETVAELFKGKESLPVAQKVRMIHEYIVKNIRYSSVGFRQSGLIPQKASKTLITKVGDCKDVSTLFVAMCTEAGIPDARLVLIDTRDNGRNALLLPSIDFNHCIAAITMDGKEHFVELTSDKNGFATFNESLKNSLALRVFGEKESAKPDIFYLDAPTRMPDNILTSSTVQFGTNKDLIKNTSTVRTGHLAAYYRYKYADKSEEERKKQMLGTLTDDSPGVKLNTLSFKKLDRVSDSLEIEYNYTISNVVTQITGLNIFTLPWSNKISSMGDFSEEKRKYPLNLWNVHVADRVSETLVITLPVGKVLAETPKNVTHSCFAAEYKMTYKISAGKIEAIREWNLKADVITPEKYAEFRAFYEKVIAEDTRQLAYK